MPNEQINNYIQQSRQQGMPDEQIRQNLLKAGWKEEQIRNTFGQGSRNAQTTLKKPLVWAILNTILIMIATGTAQIVMYYFYEMNSKLQSTMMFNLAFPLTSILSLVFIVFNWVLYAKPNRRGVVIMNLTVVIYLLLALVFIFNN